MAFEILGGNHLFSDTKRVVARLQSEETMVLVVGSITLASAVILVTLESFLDLQVMVIDANWSMVNPLRVQCLGIRAAGETRILRIQS